MFLSKHFSRCNVLVGCHICVTFLLCSPPINPPKEISDVNDKKPRDWDERERYRDILRVTLC